METYMGLHRLELFELGMAVNAAMGPDPKKHLGNILNPPKTVTREDLPRGPFRPPPRKPAPSVSERNS